MKLLLGIGVLLFLVFMKSCQICGKGISSERVMSKHWCEPPPSGQFFRCRCGNISATRELRNDHSLNSCYLSDQQQPGPQVVGSEEDVTLKYLDAQNSVLGDRKCLRLHGENYGMPTFVIVEK